MYVCRSLSFLICTMHLYTLNHSFNKRLKKMGQPRATVLGAEIQQGMRQTWSPPSVVQRVLLWIKGNTAVFEYWTFHVVQTIRYKNDSMRWNCYNSCIQPTFVWPPTMSQVKKVNQQADWHSPHPHGAFGVLEEVHFNQWSRKSA